MHFVHPKSVLCMPILNQGNLVGILYLENQLTQGVFTSDRLVVLNFLCSQAAISLENARLHALEREKSEHLEQSQRRLQLIIQETSIVIIEWNTDFEFQAWNPAAERVFGYQAAEILGKSLRCIIPEEYHVYVDDVKDKILAQRGGSHAINENLTKDGRRIICEWFNAPMVNSEGEVCGGVSMGVDITDRQQAEAALQQKSQELEQALQNLQQAQLQIIQSEKMSALGNLVAGVAHEINNPVGFIKGNIQPAYEGVRDLFALLKLYEDKFPDPGEEIELERENIDLEYLREDLPKLICSMQEGVQRIREISNSLRIFSRADSDNKVPFNIHDGLDSTLLILKHRLKANENRPAITVVKNYGQLPQIDCFPGQLNQVFMNLLANAIDALEESNMGRSFAEIKAHPNVITITTKMSDDQKQAIMSIQDNGLGISPELQEKIFDHLYTTKIVGKGTGLGLAIARQIVIEKHQGTIEVNSAPNQGAEFIITLPK
ncbi:GAF domain-containing sensor histidine kinase [Nostoc sp. CMAA1605]|uniref:GAF domain-containing sensor histidine kinase n=1 Tax=Nostoc sp. CMAA1605 TaxID=2055159 RepID=UPI001F8D0181|nr:ATP-binding protein [Nostoc sp. CMAA1605]MCF4968313.1 hypothetical protein [Nostoc sp. CMAA1605]